MTTSYCQTWATPSTHIRHPWFDTVIMKRKHLEIVSPDEELSPSSSPTRSSGSARPAAARTPPPKRRRFSELENGFAHMSLSPSINAKNAYVHPTSLPAQPGLSIPPPSNDNVPPAFDPFPRIQDVTPVSMDAEPFSPSAPFPPASQPLAYTVEEPHVPDVKMKTSSWYEPEPDRIVITDIDSFTQSDDELDDAVNETATVNPILLDRIRASASLRSPSINPSRAPPASANQSQALVLFKPLPLSDIELQKITETRERQQQEAVTLQSKRTEEAHIWYKEDDDAMDVEP